MNELIRMADGGRFLLRPMRAADAEAVTASFASLSPASRRLRFFTPMPRITAGMVADLTAVEPGRRIVLLAFDPTTGALAGEARAVRWRADPTRADVAVTVGDIYQRRGLGRALLWRVGREARSQGIERLCGHVLVDNAPARALLAAAGTRTVFDEPGVLRFELSLQGSGVAAA